MAILRQGKVNSQEGNNGRNGGIMTGTGTTRGTDDAFYHLMLIGGEAVLKLLGVKDPTGYETKAVVLKSKEVRPDILALPGGLGREARERVYIEFQGYKSDMIRYSLASGDFGPVYRPQGVIKR
jgi:hypothetical protein